MLSSFYISYKFTKKNSRKFNSFYNVRLIQGWGCINDIITISFSDEFYEHLKNNTFPMPFHKKIFKLNIILVKINEVFIFYSPFL